MDSVALWMEDEEIIEERITRRYIRNEFNIMELSQKVVCYVHVSSSVINCFCIWDYSFIQNFRLSKEAFDYVLRGITEQLTVPIRSAAVNPAIKLAAILKFLGQVGYQHQISQDRFAGLAQSTTSKCIAEVLNAIEKTMCPKHIKFEMSSQEKREAKNYFYSKFGLPGIMVICDHNMYIRAVNGVCGGAAHDAHVWSLSNERQYVLSNYQNGDKSSWLIGDSGYPLEPWLLTPYRNAEENSFESLYNEKFTKASSIIERVFGILKIRFRCLLAGRELHYAPKKVVKILNVCSALHNICLIYNVEAPTVIETYEERSNLALTNAYQNEFSRIAQTIRDRFKISLRS